MQIEQLRGKQLDELFDAILSLKTREELYYFFNDLATVSETQAFAQRFIVAKMLSEGRTYQEIEEKTTASTATISRVRRSIDYGSGGYEIVFNRINK